MSFNPLLPADHSELSSAEMRSQFTGLKDLIDAVPAGPPGPAGPQGEPGPLGPQGEPAPIEPETDPVFAASEAAQFLPGDKTKLDASLTSPLGADLHCSEFDLRNASHLTLRGTLRYADTNTPVVDVQNHALCNAAGQTIVGFRGYIPGVDDPGSQLNDGAGQGFLNTQLRTLIAGDGLTVAATWADGTLKTGNGAPFSTGAFSPANPGHWAGSPPATVAEALDRLAAAVSNNGANPLPV